MRKEERQRRTKVKLEKRKRLMISLGLQPGLLYQRHREKIQVSVGYMRTGNVSHFVITAPRRKTRSRKRYGHIYEPSIRDTMQHDSMKFQMEDFNDGIQE